MAQKTSCQCLWLPGMRLLRHSVGQAPYMRLREDSKSAHIDESRERLNTSLVLAQYCACDCHPRDERTARRALPLPKRILSLLITHAQMPSLLHPIWLIFVLHF